MSKKWKQIIYNERQGQQLLFGYDFPDMTLMKGYDIKTDLQNASIGSINLKDLLVKTIEKYGVSFSLKEYIDMFKEMEQETIRVSRYPSITQRGKLVTSWDYDKYRITVSTKNKE